MMEHLYPHMLQEYYVARVRALSKRRARTRARISTPDEVHALKARARQRLQQSFGRFPPKTPLNARVTGCLDRDAYTVENVILESRPGFPVTANLYVPKAAEPPFPCVLGACGHSGVGKAEFPAYQGFAQALARQGYMVLVYDPISQGERLQYPAVEGKAQPHGCCQEHNMAGNQMSLVGQFFGLWRVWDGIRSLDYLLSRPEADPTRVGVTGNSGGGTLSTYLNGLEDRFTMAAPSCFVTTYLANLENELPADSEQIPPNILKYGLDMADFFVAQLPRPVLLLGQKNDYFDCRGLRQTYDELRRLYGLVGAEDSVQLFIGPSDHGYSEHNRGAMVSFFNGHAGLPANDGACELLQETQEDLAASPSGQVWEMGAKRVFDFTKATAGRVQARRKRLGADALSRALQNELVLPPRPAPPHYRILRARGGDARPYARHSSFALETEPGIQAILHLPASDAYYHFPRLKRTTLYVPHTSSQQDVLDGHAPQTEEHLFCLDVRGVGQSMALTCANADYFAPYGNDYFYTSYANMLGEPYVGRRVHDVLSALDLLRDNGCESVHLVGRGLGAIAAAAAAVLHPSVKRVTLKNALLSYFELTQVPVQSWPQSCMLQGVLRRFDLPDCYRALEAKSLALVDPWTSQMETWAPAALPAHADSLGLPRDLFSFSPGTGPE